MTRIWHVFWREFWGHVSRKGYILFTFGFPAFLTVVPAIGGMVLAVAIATAMPETDLRPVGVVDQVNLLDAPLQSRRLALEFQRLPTVAVANAQLRNGQIQAYYLIPADYWSTGTVKIIYDEAPTAPIDNVLMGWVTRRVRAQVPDGLLDQLSRPPKITQQTLSGERVFSASDLVTAGIVFFFSYFVQLGASFTASYMFDSIASEANDRTIEIIITSISPLQFLLGKVVGLLLVGLTQLGVWASLGLIVAVFASNQLEVNLISLVFGWEHFPITVSLLLGAYVITQFLAAVVGFLQMNNGSGPLLFNTLNWVVGFGWIYAITFVPRSPHTWLAVGTSLFPLTAPIVMLVRVIVSEVPTWQLVLAQLLLWGSALATLFLLRRLLKINLVAYAPRFRLWPWLKRRVLRRV